jgi:hypothetical protein
VGLSWPGLHLIDCTVHYCTALRCPAVYRSALRPYCTAPHRLPCFPTTPPAAPPSQMVAGHETTATTLAWTLYYLCRNPDCEAKALAEIQVGAGRRWGSTKSGAARGASVCVWGGEVAVGGLAGARSSAPGPAPSPSSSRQYLAAASTRSMPCSFPRSVPAWPTPLPHPAPAPSPSLPQPLPPSLPAGPPSHGRACSAAPPSPALSTSQSSHTWRPASARRCGCTRR